MNCKKKLLAVECALLFFILPASLYFFRFAVAYNIIPLIILSGVFGYGYLRKAAGMSPGAILQPEGFRGILLEMLTIFLPLAVLLTVFAPSLLMDKFLVFPQTRPMTWALVMLLYPFFAAVPQELFFRAFFFHRYQPLFPDPRWLIMVNGLSFGLAHIVYGNWVAPVLTTFGGLLFGYHYHRSKSIMATSFEHGLWGNFLLTIGYGWYFYSGPLQ